MTASPRVSVIIPAHNAAATLPATLASVQAQSFTDHELVLVDDGSGDDTGAIARAAGARVFRNESPHGPSAARNRGAREARGELIATLDADDTIEPRYLESQLAVYDRAVTAGRRVGAVSCDARLVSAEGEIGLWSQRVGGPPDVIDLMALLHENYVFGNAVILRSAFLSLGGYDEDPAQSVEDYDLWVRMAEQRWEIVTNPEVLATYNLGDSSRSTHVADTAHAAARLLEELIARGALTPAEIRAARRRIRVHRVVAARADIAIERRPARKLRAAIRAAPLTARSALEHPERWAKWLRRGTRPTTSGRHTWRH